MRLPKCYIEFEVKKDGKILKKGKFKSKSWVGNILGLLSCIISGVTIETTDTTTTDYVKVSRTDLVDVANISRGLAFGYPAPPITFGAKAPSGVDGFGICVGNNDTPVAIDQYDLLGKISHGTGSGQLSYGETTIDSLVKDTTWNFKVSRTFTNNSGATITIREIGLLVQLRTAIDSGSVFLLARDVPTSPIDVADGAILTIRYTISYSL